MRTFSFSPAVVLAARYHVLSVPRSCTGWSDKNISLLCHLFLYVPIITNRSANVPDSVGEYLKFLSSPESECSDLDLTPHEGRNEKTAETTEVHAGFSPVSILFFPSRYDQITPSERKKSPPFKYDVDPVVHNRRLLQSGKINKIETRSKLIKVWPNGDDLRGPRRVLLSPRINPFTLTNVMAAVNEIMKEDLNGTVEKLYFVNGIKVSDVDQISHNGFYVACKKSDRFKNCRYSESGTKNLSTSPRLERKFLAPLNYSRSNNSTQSSPEHSNASTQNSTNGHPPRRRAARRDDEQVFPARPVKHTRSSEKNRAVDLDKDQGGMFKAKQNNRTTHGAREVQENRHTRTELPVDQRQAKPVEEERLPKGKKV
ncbi:hypothetical protein RRG08_023861 [Elysia crispata]|uniref:Doublecortin domain-containing protein n=1 Tax=Elysia crispata TaxID=231223 RepID=A0AAE1E5G4_9GAST|nr:hypothetical protein RRG08_023861 [Elysia crispata]